MKPAAGKRVQINICGEIFSQNLGDGVIGISLAWLLKKARATAEVCFVDISGRPGFEAEDFFCAGSQNRLRSLHRLFLKNSVYKRVTIFPIWYFSKRKRYVRIWQEALKECDLVLIGGGQLLMDNSLDFPLKIRELVRVAHGMNKGIAYYSCGVGRKWSRLGHRLLAESVCAGGVCWLSVRDNGSRDMIGTLFPHHTINCHLSMDPAICAAEAFGVSADSKSTLVGLGISEPNTLKRSTVGKNDFSAKQVVQFWVDLAELLVADRHEVVFFTNGQTDDYAFAKEIVDRIKIKSKKEIVLLKRACSPQTLVDQISRFRAIVAHRLHSNIIAYSLGIPSVGLIWDKKVAEFGKISGRSRFYLGPFEMSAQLVRQRLWEAMENGIDPFQLLDRKALVLENVKEMLVSTKMA